MQEDRIKLISGKSAGKAAASVPKQAQETEEDVVLNISLRPTKLTEFTGQTDIVDNLKISLTAAKQRKETL
ncbi:MAG: hypothetical protein WC478_06025, partial [Candidatus Omnitrophota bacterium]